MRTTARTTLVAGLLLCLAACGGSAEDPPTVEDPAPATDPTTSTPPGPDELAMHDGEPCPDVLPRAPRETYGFGTDALATETPDLPTDVDQGWVCAYGTRDIAGRGSNGAWFEWVRQGRPRPLDADQLADTVAALDGLALIEGEYSCTDDLGPRHLLALSRDGDLTGVVVDDYGCGFVRLTDDPFTTVPGDASPTTVAGVLEAPDGLLDGVGADR